MRYLLGVLGLSLLLAPAADAAPFSVTGYTLGEQIEINSSLVNGTVHTFTLEVNSDGLEATSFCVDIAQFIGTETYNDFTNLSLGDASALTGLDYRRAAYLFESAAPGLETLSGDALTATITGAQIAIWETLYETSGTFDLTTGDFSAVASAEALAVAADLLSDLGGIPLDELEGLAPNVSTVAYSPTYQDQLLRTLDDDPNGEGDPIPDGGPTPTPEPGAALLFLTGLGVIAARLRCAA